MSFKGIIKASELVGGELDNDITPFPSVKSPDDKANNDMKPLHKPEQYDKATGMLASATQTAPAKGVTFNKASDVYHGSPSLLDKIDPKNMHGDPDVDKVVFAAPERSFALAYSGKKWGDRDIHQSGHMKNKKHVTFLEEMRPGALEDIYKDITGYLYSLPEESFKKGETLGRQYELISNDPVIPKNVEVINNVLDELTRAGVVLKKYNPRERSYRRAVNRMIDRVNSMTPKGKKEYLSWVAETNPELAENIGVSLAGQKKESSNKYHVSGLIKGVLKNPDNHPLEVDQYFPNDPWVASMHSRDALTKSQLKDLMKDYKKNPDNIKAPYYFLVKDNKDKDYVYFQGKGLLPKAKAYDYGKLKGIPEGQLDFKGEFNKFSANDLELRLRKMSGIFDMFSNKEKKKKKPVVEMPETVPMVASSPAETFQADPERLASDPSIYEEDVDDILSELKRGLPANLSDVDAIPQDMVSLMSVADRRKLVAKRTKERLLQILMDSLKQDPTADVVAPLVEKTSALSNDSALGIPSRKNYGDLSQLTPGQFMTLIGQRHSAKRAGEHLDLRIGNPDLGLFSWAVPKGMPEPGSKPVLAVQQPLHNYNYKNFEGYIPYGTYGGGRVKKELENEIVLTKVSPDKLDFTIGGSRGGNRYTLIKTHNNDWLLRNSTITEAPIEDIKQKYKDISLDVSDLDEKIKGRAASAKIDGALALLAIKQRGIEAYSPRKSKTTGYPIMYTEKLGIQNMDVPKELVGKLLRGEVYAEKNGQVLPPNEIAGLLNTNLNEMLRKVRNEGITFKIAPFDIVSGKQMSFGDKQKQIEQIVQALGSDRFSVPPYETEPDKIKQLIETIRSGKHPLTSEGVVLQPLEGGTPEKLKFKDEKDVIIRKIFEAVTKGGPRRAGGFSYSTEMGGPIVGRVGTGFDHATLIDMIDNPDKYVNNVARVTYSRQSPSGALVSPRFITTSMDE